MNRLNRNEKLVLADKHKTHKNGGVAKLEIKVKVD